MSRIAKKPVELIDGASFKIEGNSITISGKSELSLTLNKLVTIEDSNGSLVFKPVVENKQSWAMAGTMRSLVNNMVIGVTKGYEKKLKIIGVGYRAAIKGSQIDLSLGFSHPVIFDIPEGVKVESPSQTELTISGADKQLVGEVAAKIRAYRPPEPYKGKGVRYADEQVKLKEAKKK